jgi:hypothetical protein
LKPWEQVFSIRQSVGEVHQLQQALLLPVHASIQESLSEPATKSFRVQLSIQVVGKSSPEQQSAPQELLLLAELSMAQELSTVDEGTSTVELLSAATQELPAEDKSRPAESSNAGLPSFVEQSFEQESALPPARESPVVVMWRPPS